MTDKKNQEDQPNTTNDVEDLPEMGYQNLNTTFTGKIAPELSGAAAFFMPDSDKGIAKSVEE